jgi:lipid A 3-O-deacylase
MHSILVTKVFAMLFKRLFELAPVRLLVASAVALMLVWAPAARAQSYSDTFGRNPQPAPHFLYELKLGILGHDQSYWLSHHRRENKMGVDLNLDVTFTPAYHVPYFGGAIRPAVGGTLSAIGTNLGYVDARYEINGPLWAPKNLFFMVGLGAAIHNGNLQFQVDDRKAFGSRILFHIPAEIGWRFNDHHSLGLYVEHVSNARLATPNEGMDNAGVRYGYRF